MKKSFTLVLFGLLAAASANAQWNTTSKPVNIIPATGMGDYSICDPSVERTSNGRTWIVFKNWDYAQINDTTFKSLGVHTYVQLLDVDGTEMFADPGICLNADYQTPTWWSYYGMGVTSDGSLVVGLADSRSESTATEPSNGYLSFQPSIYKIDQDGNFLWGDDGITFPDYQSAPYTQICVNGDDVFFQFQQTQSDMTKGISAGSYVERIAPDGTLAWQKPKRLAGQIVPSTDGDLLVFDSGNNGSRCTRYTRDINLTNPVWQTTYDDNFYGGHEVRPYKIAPDGEGGAAVAFVRNVGQYSHNIRIQHISGDGTPTFGTTGFDTYNSEDGDHDYCGISINPKNKEFLVDWEDQINDNYYTVSIGKYNYSGDRLWGDKGIATAGKESESGFAWASLGTGALSDSTWIVAYRDQAGYSNESIIIKRVDSNGKQIWKKTIGRSLSITDPTLIVEPDCSYIFWREQKEGSEGITGIRIVNNDGTYNSIKSISGNSKSEPVIESVYNANGMKLSAPQPGLNIVKYSDGSVKKIVIRK